MSVDDNGILLDYGFWDIDWKAPLPFQFCVLRANNKDLWKARPVCPTQKPNSPETRLWQRRTLWWARKWEETGTILVGRAICLEAYVGLVNMEDGRSQALHTSRGSCPYLSHSNGPAKRCFLVLQMSGAKIIVVLQLPASLSTPDTLLHRYRIEYPAPPGPGTGHDRGGQGQLSWSRTQLSQCLAWDFP